MKLLRFQRTFLEKSFVSGFGRKPQLTFLIRKVSQRISHRTHRSILAKLLKFQETFLEKFLVSRFGAEAPTDNAHTKKHGVAVLFKFLYLAAFGVFRFAKQIFVVGYPVFVVIIFESGFYCLLRKNGAMHFVRGEPVERFGNRFVGEL